MLNMPNLIREWKKASLAVFRNGRISGMLTDVTGRKAKLDQVPQVDTVEPEGSARLIVQHVIPAYSCRNTDQFPSTPILRCSPLSRLLAQASS